MITEFLMNLFVQAKSLITFTVSVAPSLLIWTVSTIVIYIIYFYWGPITALFSKIYGYTIMPFAPIWRVLKNPLSSEVQESFAVVTSSLEEFYKGEINGYMDEMR